MPPQRTGPLRRWLSVLGPGLITGAADDDPSGISTYAIAGASTGYMLTGLLALTTPMMAVVQGMCARIALVSGSGLATAIRKHFHPAIVYTVAVTVIAANVMNAGADLEGMAASAQMVARGPSWLWILGFGLLLTALQIFCSYRALATIIKWLTLSLFAYVVTAFIVHVPWLDVARHVVLPSLRLDASTVTTAMALLGTTITPYLFFWQAALGVEEEKNAGKTTVAARRGATQSEIADAHLDVNTGMVFSNVVAFFIIVATAATLYAHGHRNIATAQDAARALEPLAGRFAYGLFTIGMVATGLLAIPALIASSAYVAAETLQWRRGLDMPWWRAPGFYGTLFVCMLLATGMGLARIDAMKALYWSAVINGIVAVPLLAIIVSLASSKELMGRWRSSIVARLWGWLTVAVMGAAAIGTIALLGRS